MRVLPFLIFCLVLVSAAPIRDLSGGHGLSRDCVLSPWSGGEKKVSLSRAEDRITDSFKNNERPDIFDIDQWGAIHGTSDAALLDGAKLVSNSLPQPFLSGNIDILRKRITFIMPAVYLSLSHLFEKYSDHTLVFLGRDCNLLYDAARLFARGTAMENKIKLLPASMSMLYYIRDGLRESRIDVALVREYLAMAGISEKSLKNGERFVFLDTAFRGSAPARLQEIIGLVFGHIARSKAYVSRHGSMGDHILSRLFLASGEDSGDFHKQLMFPHALDAYKSAVSGLDGIDTQMGKLVSDFEGRTTREIIGVGMQIFPRYMGGFTRLVRGADGRPVCVAVECKQDDNLVVPGYNPDAFNPPAALVSQLLLADTISKHIQGRLYGAGSIRDALVSKDGGALELAA